MSQESFGLLGQLAYDLLHWLNALDTANRLARPEGHGLNHPRGLLGWNADFEA